MTNMKKDNEKLNIEHAAYYAWTNCYRVWHLLLVHHFGKRAGDVRYTPEGKGAAGKRLARRP
jgi:hypothetical protein